MKALIFGAGGTGRGCVGPLLAQAGYALVFVDAEAEALRERKEYRYTLAASTPKERRVAIEACLRPEEGEAVAEAVADCDIVALTGETAELEAAVPLLAKGLIRRFQRCAPPVNVLVCDHMRNAARRMESWIDAVLGETERGVWRLSASLVEAAVGCATVWQGERLFVEEYPFLPVDAAAWVGEWNAIPGLIPDAPFAFYDERRLFMQGMAHSMCAYLGILKGYARIDEALGDACIRVLVQSALTEVAAMLAKRYGKEFARVYDHAEDLLLRFRNPLLRESCAEAAKDVLRKLAPGERFVGALSACEREEINPVYIALAIAAALLARTREEAEALRIAVTWCGLSPGHVNVVMEAYRALATETNTMRALWRMESIKRGLRGNTV